MLENLARALEGNPASARRNRFARLAIAVRAGEEAWTVRLGGPSVIVERGLPADPDITLEAPPAAWRAFAKVVPPPGYQTLHAMLRVGHLKAGGKLLELGRHLLLIEEVFAHMRPPPQTPAAAPPKVGAPWIEAVTGRYLHADIEERPHRIYFEEAGPPDGIPLICLHTAGADGRQWRAVINDREITQAFRVIAFDLPWHGKSSPPPGFEREVYRLTTERYMAAVMTVANALGLKRPVVMGCSIGGRAVLHLALRYGGFFRAAIGLQSALHADADADPRLRELELIHRPDVHGGEASAAFIACLIAPASPPGERYETLWHYAQSGPGVFAGDLVYYLSDGDMRNLDLAPLKEQRCPLYLLTGEYDLSATPALTEALARQVGAAHVEIMPQLGHFPMSEAPERFLAHLRPVLERIRGAPIHQ